MKTCNKCRMSFSKEAQLAKHNETIHKIAINFTCEKCDHIFPSLTTYSRHRNKNNCVSNRENSHPSFETNFDCEMSESDYEINNTITNEFREDFEKENTSN